MLCRIGNVEVWRILEINAPFLEPGVMFPTAGPEVGEIIRDLVPGQICPETGRLILPVQGYLLKTPRHTVLVDSCVGNGKTSPLFPEWHRRDDSRFMASLLAAGLTPDDVNYVLCTHLHIDHVGWNTRLEDGRWVPTFPNARYLLPSIDNDYFGAEPEEVYNESVLPVIEAGQAELVQPGHKLGDEVKLVPTPGHTPGHVSVLVTSGGQQAVITGDTMHSAAQCWHPEWHFAYDLDAEMAVASRRRLLEEAAEHDYRVLGSHVLLPSLGRVRAEGDAFRWVWG